MSQVGTTESPRVERNVLTLWKATVSKEEKNNLFHTEGCSLFVEGEKLAGPLNKEIREDLNREKNVFFQALPE